MSLRCRLLPLESAAGPHHMAADEVLLEAAEAGAASLRCYTWAEPTLSLGYFQPAQRRFDNERLASLPWVRRASGGAALVHHHELTYCLALPAGPAWQGREPWPQRMHRVIVRALADLGVPCALACAGPATSFTGVLCFQHVTPCDVLLGGAKVAGSAQRRRRGALIQHGSVLLARSPVTPELPGILELSGSTVTPENLGKLLSEAVATEAGWELQAEGWTANDCLRIEELVVTRYAQSSWNSKR